MKPVLIIILFILISCCKSYDFPAEKKREKLLANDLKLGYNEKVKEPEFKHLNMKNLI